MSFFDDASLVMIPSGYKDQKVYSVKPIDGSGDLTFSRGSDIEATRVASNGYIQKAAVNLLLQSNTFSTSWSTSSATVTGGQSGYDGSSNAWLLQATATTSTARLQQGVSLTGVHTTSIYAKAGTTDWIAVQMWSNHFAYFDVANGVVGGSGSAIDAAIESVGNGFYRCSITYNASSVGNMWVYVIDGNGSTNVTSGKTAYVQSAQVNYGLVAQEYQETTTTSVITGITNDMPRLDYSGGASCPSLLLEPSRQNLVANSEYFPNIGTGLSATNNFSTSPEGVSNSTKLTELAGTNTKLVTIDSVSYTSGTTYTHSFFAKSTSRYIQMYFSNSIFTNDYANFDLVNGVVGGKSGDVTSSIEDYGNGWLRCIATIVAPLTGAASNLLLLIDDVNATRGQSYTGDGSSFAEIYGFQCEAGSYPTSYIPCYGTSNSRTSESCSKTGISSLIGQTEGTIFWEGKVPVFGQQLAIITSAAGNEVNRLQLYVDATGKIGLYRGDASVNILSASTYAVGSTLKIAGVYKLNDCALYVNGVLVGTDTSATIPPTPSVLYLSQYVDGTASAASIAQALLFKTRLSNADLATLTA